MNTTDLALEHIGRRLRNAQSRADAARVDLAEAAAETPHVTWERLTTLAQDVAYYEGQTEVWASVESVAKGSGVDSTAIRDYLIQTLTQHPGDTWSGRGNDAARRHNDGRREALSAAHDALQYGW